MSQAAQAKVSRGGYDLFEEVTGIKRGTGYALVSKKQVPHIRISSRLVIFDRFQLEDWLKSKSISQLTIPGGEYE